MPCEHTVPSESAANAADQPTRRRFLQASGLIGAGAAALAVAGAPSALASAIPAVADAKATANTANWRPDEHSARFTVVVMPDTQYLFDDQSIHPAPLEASLKYVLDRHPAENIVALAHLGDITQNGLPWEMASAGKAFQALDRHHVTYSVLAGNHDIHSSTDDQRGDSPYLQAFGPSRFAGAKGYQADADGYNTARLFRAAGRQWLLLALDWRSSDAGIAWAQKVIADNPTTPVILTTHDLVYATDNKGSAVLSDHGQQLWDRLIKDNDQVFLTLNGHYWPPGRTTLANTAGHDVHLHITNYQDRYYGGAAMIRLYRFDLERNTIDVETMAPWLLDANYAHLNELSREELELTSDVDRFAIPVDFSARFQGFAPAKIRAARPAHSLLVPGTQAYWRFDLGSDGGKVPDAIPDLSGNHNTLAVAHRPGSRSDALTLSREHHPDQPAHGSVRFRGGRAAGDYLKTVAGAAINAATFGKGFTFEAFFKLPADWGSDSAWSSVLTRQGSSGDAGKTGGYSRTEPVATLSLSGSAEAQWYVYPLNLNTSVTNWSHLLPLDVWVHLAITNDGKHTVMYVDGCEVVRNPATVANGIATVTKSWLIGGHEDGGAIDQIHYGWIGDVRIVNHALPVGTFMNA